MTWDPSLLGSVVESAPDGIVVVDATGRVVFANQRTAAMLGYAPGDLLGQPIEVLVPGRFRGLHVRHREAYQDRPSARPMGSGLRLTALRKDGTEMAVEISLSPLPSSPGMVTAIIRDVSERDALESARRRAEEQYRLLADHATDIIYRVRLVPPPAAVEYISPACSTITGFAPEDYYADPGLFLRIADPADRPLIERLLEDPDNAASRLLMRVQRRDGALVWLEQRFTVIRDSDGRPIAIEGIARDTTQRVAEEDERQQLRAEAELQQDRERIARDLHDGVMQAIYGVGLTLMDAQGRTATAPAEASARIEEAVGTLREVITDIRQYVLNLPLDRSEGNIRAALHRLLAAAASRSALTTTFEVPEELPDLTEAQRDGLIHVAQEALANVQKHAHATEAGLRVHVEPGALTLKVQDNGNGFDPAESLDPEHMGLRNMRTRAEQLGGTVILDSAPGRGTTLSLRLPIET